MNPRLRFGVSAIALLIGLSLATSRWSQTLPTFLRSALAVQSNSVFVLSAASYEALVTPDSLATAFGSALATTTATGTDTDPNTPGIQLPTTLGGTYVEINGQRAGLIFVSPTQINMVIPATVTAGLANVRVVAGNGVNSTGTVQVNTLAPAIFTANANGSGVPAAVLLRINQAGTQSFESLLQLDAKTGKVVSKPIDLGPEGEQVYVILYATGIRRANDTNGDGNLNETVRVLLAGSETTPQFAGRLPELAGLDQVNQLIPRSLLGRGKVSLSLNLPGAPASNVVEIEIAGAASVTPPQVNNFGATSALAGQLLTIQGNGFAATPANNLVRIGDLEAQVTTATTSQLTVIVPYGAETAPVTVRTTTGETTTTNPLPVRTSVSGVIETTNRQPLSDVTVRVTSLANGQTVTTKTGANGVFVAADTPTGGAFIKIIGSSVSTSPMLETLTLPVTIISNRDNPYIQTVYLQPLSGASAQVGGSGFTFNGAPHTLTIPVFSAAEDSAEGLLAQPSPTKLQTGNVIFELPADAAVTFPDGATRGTITLTQVESSRLPVRFPEGVFSSVVVQLTPFGTRFNPGGKLSFPNSDGYPAGAEVKLFKLDQGERSPTLGRFVEAGTATVSGDGQRIETAAGAITEAAYYFVAVQRQTTTVIGRALDADGSPVRRALIRARGQEQYTDGNGGFILRNVPVLPGQDLLTVEASLLRPSGRVERLQRTGISTVANGTTSVTPELVFGSATANQPPVLFAPANATALAGLTTELPLLASDPDSEQPVTVTVSGAGFATVIPNGILPRSFALRLTPVLADAGERDLTLTATDNQGATTTRTLRLTVTIPNRAPSIANQRVTTDEDIPAAITLNATDPDNSPLTFTLVAPPTQGTLSGTAPNLTYTPNQDFNGTDSFTFKASDGEFESNTATFTIVVTPVNDAPVLTVPGPQTIAEDQTLSFVVSATDVDEGQTLKYSAPSLPTGASFIESERRFVWKPNFNQAGNYTVLLAVLDNGTLPKSDTKTVSITVTDTNRAPGATAANSSTNEDQAVQISLTGNDPDGDPITFVIVNAPGKGAITGITPAGVVTYTPNKDFNGTDSFTFKTNDGVLDSAPATVTVTVTPVNDAPSATAQSVTVVEDTPKQITLTGADPDGDTLSFVLVTAPLNGLITNITPAGVITYTPNKDYNGADSFTFKASDGTTESAPATVQITVTPVNDVSRALAQTVTLDEDSQKQITLAGTDADNDQLTFSIVAQPRNGTLSGTLPVVIYTPRQNFSGTDSFTFKVNDGTADSPTATVNLIVTGFNDAPVLTVPETQTVAEGANLSFTISVIDPDGNDTVKVTAPQLPTGASFIESERRFTWTPNFNQAGTYTVGFGASDNGTPPLNDFKTVTITVTNTNRAPQADTKTVTTNEDTAVAITLTGADPDGDAITLAVVTPPQRGVLSGTAPNLTYTPNKDVNGSDSFTIKANDGSLDSQLAVITINLTPVNDAPVLSVPGPQAVNEGQPLAFTLTSTDVDMGQAYVYSSDNLPSGATLNPQTGVFAWTPGKTQAGSYTVNFTVTDNGAPPLNNTKSVTITVTNPAPVASAANVTLDEDTPKQFTLPAADPDNDPLTYIIVTPPMHGTLSGTAPNLTYTPGLNHNGTDSFTFKVNDGSADSNIATISLIINSVNDAPVLSVPPVQTINENQLITFIISATDVDAGQTLTFSASNLPTGATFDTVTRTFNWTPTFDQQGTYTVNFTATDSHTPPLSDTKPVQINVNNVNRAPVAQNQQLTVNEDQAQPFTLQASDPDGDALMLTVVAAPQHGTLTGTLPNLTYTPSANFNGTDSFTYKVRDLALESAVVTVSITINPVNDAPVLNVPGPQSVNEGAPLTFTLTAMDVDTGQTFAFSSANLPSGATLNPQTGVFAWTPNFTQAGSYAVNFTATDNGTPPLSETKTVTIVVGNVQTPPSAVPQQLMTDEETALAITLTGTDPQGDALTYAIVSQPANGVLTGTAPSVSYTPKKDFTGTDSFTFKVNDGTVDSSPATITITVKNVNDAPVALAQAVQVTEDTPKEIVLTATDVDSDMLSFTVVTQPAHGTLSGTAPALLYTPNANFNGNDAFTFKANDGQLDSNTATVSIVVGGVNDPPAANAQEVTTNEDVPRALTLTGSDPDGDSLSFIIVNQPAHGVLTGTGANLTYTPNANFNGNDAFTFKANDGAADSAPATVSIAVAPVNDAPVLTVPGAQMVGEGALLEFTVSATDVDGGQTLTLSAANLPAGAAFNPETGVFSWTPSFTQQGAYTVNFTATDNGAPSLSDTKPVTITVSDTHMSPSANGQMLATDEDVSLPITLTGTDPENLPLTYMIVTPPAKGVLQGTAPALTYVPNPNANGADSFTFKVNNGILDSNVAVVALTINPINDAPTLSAPEARTATEGETISFTVSVNDVDAGQTLTLSSSALPAGATFNTETGAFSWTPAFNQSGNYSIIFSVSDNGNPVLSANRTTGFVINDINRPPVADSFPVTISEDTPGPITLTGSDPDGDTFTFIIVTQPAHGVLSGTPPNLTYTPAQNYSGPDSFNFKTNDGKVDSVNALVTIAITAANDPPVLTVPATLNVNENQAVNFIVSAVDPDGGQTITLSATNLPSGATFNAPTGAFSWPSAAPVGSYTVSFSATDNGSPALTDTKSVQINVGQGNLPPNCTAQTASTNEDTPVQIPLVSACTDPNSNPLTYALVSQPASGTVTLTGTTATYTPNSNFNGNDSFTFKASDGSLESSPTTVTVTVNPVCDAPVLTVPGAQTVAVTTLLNFTVAASDPDGPPLTLEALDLPSGATFTPITDGTSGQFTWTPASTFPPGNVVVTFKVTDNCSPTPLVETKTVTITVTQTTQEWSPAPGPEGGKIIAFATNGANLFAATQGGGIFRSSNNGDSWTEASKGLVSRDVTALVAQNGVLYAGTASDGIFRSADNGDNWSAFNTGLSEFFIFNLAANETHLFAITSATFFGALTVQRTPLNEANWTKFNNNLPANDFYTDLQTAGAKVFVSSFDGGVYASSASAAEWSSFNGGFGNLNNPPFFYNSLTANGSSLFVATDTGVYTSPIESAAWTEFNTGLASNTDIRVIEVVGSQLYARSFLFDSGPPAATVYQVFRTPLERANWSEVSTGLDNRFVHAFGGLGANVFAGTEGSGVFRNTDLGSSWSRTNTGLTASFVIALATKDALLFAGTDGGGIFVSSNNGATWTAANQGLANIFPVKINAFATDGTTLYAGTGASGVYRSTDNGQTWTSFNSANFTNSPVLDLILSDNKLFAATGDAGLYATPTGTPVWTVVSVSDFSLEATALFKTNDNLFLGTGSGSVFRGDLSGANWTQTGLSFGLPVSSFALRGEVLYVGRNGDGVFSSTDNGNSFAAFNTGLQTNLNVTGLRSAGERLFVTTNGGGVFVSATSNASWVQRIVGLANLRTRAIVIKDSQTLVGTEGSGVFKRPVKD
jgi:uncharacterized protein (TIGR03437 family)